MNRPTRPALAPALSGWSCLLVWGLAAPALAAPPKGDPTKDPVGDAAPEVQRPSQPSSPSGPGADVPGDSDVSNDSDDSEDPAANDGTPSTADAPETSAAPPDDPTEAPTTSPSGTEGFVPQAPPETDATEPPADDAIPEDLLGAEPTATIPDRRPPPADVPQSIDDEEKVKRYYQSLYRPEANPGMLRVAVHGLFVAAGGRDFGGRLGGIQAEVGQSWNRVGYGIGVAAYGGDTLIGDDQYSQSYGMFGGGPTLSLGRTSLLRHGYLDVAAGYDFFYMPSTDSRFAIRDGARGESFFVPHGPRVRLDLGLIGLGRRDRKLRHGAGISLGWQGLISSLAGGRHSYGNMLMVGLSYMAQ